MPNADGYLDDQERANYEPPPCAECGGPVATGWVDHWKMNDVQNWWTPGRRQCLSDGRHQP